MHPTTLPLRAWSPDVHAHLVQLLAEPGDGPPRVLVVDWDDTMLEGDMSLSTLRTMDARHGTSWYDTYFSELRAHGRDVAYPLITQWFAGHTVASFEALARDLVAEAFRSGVLRYRPEIHDLVAAWQAAGGEVWAITASPQVIVREMADGAGVPRHHVIGMRLRLGADGRYTDEVEPPATFCEGKAEAVRRFLPRLPTLVVGDSRSDADMMALSTHALLLDGHDIDLRMEAIDRGWWLQGGWLHTPAEPGVREASP